MAVVHPSARPAAVDIAGSAWPMYKLEAVALGLVICLVLALITGSLQVAVLVAAGFGAGRWVVAQLAARRQRAR
jgi:Flp pilus assembly protein TadB